MSLFVGTPVVFGQQAFVPWMESGVDYYRIAVSEDGVYRIPFDSLPQPLRGANGNELQLFHHGEQVARFVSSQGPLTSSDFVEFYGEENNGAVDALLFMNPAEDQANVNYSLFNSTSYYYLARTGTTGISYQNADFGAQQPLTDYSITKLAGETLETYLKSFGSSLTSLSTYSTPEGWVGRRLGGEFLAVLRPSRRKAGIDGRLVLTLITDSRVGNFTIDVNGTAVKSFQVQPFEIYRDTITLSESVLTGRNEVRVIESASNTFYISELDVELPDRDFPRMDTSVFHIVRQNFSGEILPFQASEQRIAYDPAMNVRYEIGAGEDLRTNIGKSSGEVTFTSLQGTKLVSAFDPARRSPSLNPETDYILLTSNKLFGNELDAYVSLRESAYGGGHNVQVVPVEDLYDQYAYGVPRHTLAVKYFLQDAAQRVDDLKFVFIVGKGLEYGKHRTDQQVADNGALFFVPTFGFPASDVQFSTSALGTPEFAIGRLSAIEKSDITLYYDKAITHDGVVNTPDYSLASGWRKRIIHLGGGDLTNQNRIASELDVMGNVLAESDFAGNLSSYYKNSDEVIQDASSPELRREIDEGAAIITFFGHSAPGSFDFNLDNPDNYSNQGKLPLLISLGCYSGQIHSPFRSIGESFVFAENTGAIAYLATTSYGYIPQLSEWGKSFYEGIGAQSVTETIGEHLQATYAELSQVGSTNLTGLLHQMTLLGDPAIRLYPSAFPDYTTSSSLVNIENNFAQGFESEIKINYELINIGRANQDSFTVKITLSNTETGLDTLFQKRSFSPFYSLIDSVSLFLPESKIEGLNSIEIEIDSESEVDEGAGGGELNNSLTAADGSRATFFVQSKKTNVLYPYHMQTMSIDSAKVVLFNASASTSEPISSIIEIARDTSFSSTVYRNVLQQDRPLVSLSLTDEGLTNGAYFLRIVSTSSSLASAPVSFQITSENRAYSYNLDQSPNLILNNIEYSALTDEVSFAPSQLPIRIYNGIHPGQSFQAYRDIDRIAKMRGSTIASGVYVLVFEGNALLHKLNPSGGAFGSSNGLARSIGTFPFRVSTPAERQVLLDFLQNTINTGDAVGFVTIQREGSEDYFASSWAQDSTASNPVTIVNWLESQGAQNARMIGDGEPRPYVFLFRKDGQDPSERSEGLARTPGEAIDLTVNFSARSTRGSYSFPSIGPGKTFDELSIEVDAFDSVLDEVNVELRAVSRAAQGSMQQTREIRLVEGTNVIDLSSFSSADTTKVLFLKILTADTSAATPTKILSVDAAVTHLPDYVIYGEESSGTTSDILIRDTILQSYVVANPTIYETTSIVTLNDELRNGVQVLSSSQFVIPPLAAGGQSTLIDTFIARSTGTFTPSVSLSLSDGGDRSILNNIYSSSLAVATDQTNPNVSISVDGNPIQDGQLVAPSPIVELRLADDNKNAFSILSDVVVFIKQPGSTDFIPLVDIELVNEPSIEGDDNVKYFRFQPLRLPDGINNLRVEVSDPSGNASSTLNYSLEVDSKFRIAAVVNYPNPFVDRTRFSYEMRGDLPVLDYQLNIYSVSGRIVRSLGSAELGPLKVGQHLTDGHFDGRDQFGQPLARGVYLYRLDLSDALDREQAENSDESPLERYGSKGGFGKMVIIR